MIVPLIILVYNVWIVIKILIIKDIKLLSKKHMEDVVIVEMLKHGKNKDFVKNIQEKLLI
jgi:hypothetical protein